MKKTIPKDLVFGLDIGTRSIVGTVGYVQNDEFYVVAQYVKEHETRAMLDGQIHDIGKVGSSIKEVKKQLEDQIDRPLKEVCIAAAGRVLKTVTTEAEMEFPENTLITGEIIHSMDLLGVERAQEEISRTKQDKLRYFCVGYSVVKYYLDGYPMNNLENHKAEKISEELIATFLPEEVVNSLYMAVNLAGLDVANLTLEPIAAIEVAIPEMYRMLNIALVDVGAGTSDISITRDSSIIAYGMIPYAGDELTEIIAKEFLVDFKTAEGIKIGAGEEETVTFKDIMGLEMTVSSTKVQELVNPMVERITSSIADKIMELNSGKPVSAVFVVGGGGKFPGFTESLAKNLELMDARVALRGEEVLQQVHFYQEEIKKDPLLVTPIGICLNYYEQKNHFIMVQFNEERIKLYNNAHLTLVDAAMQARFPNEDLFPKRGRELYFTVNGISRMHRGELGEAAEITLNGYAASLNTPVQANDKIEIKPSTPGKDARLMIEELPEYKGILRVQVNGKKVECPKYMEVNGELVSNFYEIKENDAIVNLDYYTLKQVLDFLDVIPERDMEFFVNNKAAGLEEKVYDNFSVDWKKGPGVTGKWVEEKELSERKEEIKDKRPGRVNKALNAEQHVRSDNEPDRKTEQAETAADRAERQEKKITKEEEQPEETAAVPESRFAQRQLINPIEKQKQEEKKRLDAQEKAKGPKKIQTIQVTFNGSLVNLMGKAEYVFVDVFDFVAFELKNIPGKRIVTRLNGQNALYMNPLYNGDVIEVFWEEIV